MHVQLIDSRRDILALYDYNWACILDCRSEPMLPLHLQSESHIPLYVQLRDQLRALVHSGELRTGDRIAASRSGSFHRRRGRIAMAGRCGGNLYLRMSAAKMD